MRRLFQPGGYETIIEERYFLCSIKPDAKLFSTVVRREVNKMRNNRMRHFGLSLEEEKSRLIEFGRFAEENRRRKGKGKPETYGGSFQ